MTVFNFEEDTATFYRRFSPEKIIISPMIILEMSKATTNVFEGVQKTYSQYAFYRV